MSNRKWNTAVIIRYVLLQLPGIAVFSGIVVASYHLDFLPPWLAWTVWAIWILKDIFFYSLVWEAYDPEKHEDKRPMEGRTGVTSEKLNPEGYVVVGGESWKAEAESGYVPIEKGQKVVITKLDGMKLFVKPEK
ncbi:MAG: hypothetical protein JXL67_05055 [Calditrichaeota bacterium]|nr:hypothetical protein [Calditrichota bacterium]